MSMLKKNFEQVIDSHCMVEFPVLAASWSRKYPIRLGQKADEENAIFLQREMLSEYWVRN